MKRILVTGGTGFIGRYTVAQLLALGYEVHLVSRRPPAIRSGEPLLHHHSCDILDLQQQSNLLREVRPSHLMHFAWCTTPGEYWTSTENIAWAQFSLALLQHFVECGGSRVVFAGSCAEYDWSHGYCSEKLTPTIPMSLYGTCKNGLREIFEGYCHRTEVRAAWGRIFFLYGPHEHRLRLVPSIILSLLQGKRALCSHGQLLRDFMYVADVAAAFVALLESEVTGCVNISSGRPVAIREIVDTIAVQMGRKELVDYGPVGVCGDEPPLLVGDTSRLSDEVGFSPKIALIEGIATTIDWWKSRSASIAEAK
jgi:nucleoside-diphosphate-sugar epimerase